MILFRPDQRTWIRANDDEGNVPLLEHGLQRFAVPVGQKIVHNRNIHRGAIQALERLGYSGTRSDNLCSRLSQYPFVI